MSLHILPLFDFVSANMFEKHFGKWITSSENGNDVPEDTKPSDRRASLPTKIETHHQDDGITLTHSGRKIPSYMAPTASAKARVRGGQGSPRIGGEEKPEKNGTTRRHSLPHIANNDKLSAMSPRVHRLLKASAKGSMNGADLFRLPKTLVINRQKLSGNGEFQ